MKRPTAKQITAALETLQQALEAKFESHSELNSVAVTVRPAGADDESDVIDEESGVTVQGFAEIAEYLS